jgi:UDPglucose 6-dehydrogenase
LRVSGYEEIAALKHVFGEKHRARIERMLAGYQRHIRPHGFERHGAYATLVVREVTHEDVDTVVYSMETTTGTLITSSGLISHNCFPKDVKALMHMAAEAGLHPQLLEAVMTINQDQRRLPVDKLEEALGGAGSLAGTTVGVLGLAFKDNTDDVRDAPSLDIIRWLLEAGAAVRLFDPVAMETARAALAEEVNGRAQPTEDRIAFCADAYEAAADTDAVIVVTEWSAFRELNLARLRDAMKPRSQGRFFVDGRNLFEPSEMARLGFRYLGIGRGTERKNGHNGNGHHGNRHASVSGAKTVGARGAGVGVGVKSRANGGHARGK